MSESGKKSRLVENPTTLEELNELRDVLVDLRDKYAKCLDPEEKARLAKELRRVRLNYDRARFVYYTKLSNRQFRETRRFAYPSN